jgi:chorismate mutase
LADELRNRVAAIRGAIDVAIDTPDEIHRAVAELVRQITAQNSLRIQDIISAQFTMTPDLRSVFPAAAARAAGWTNVPMLCSTAVDVPGALGRCVRVLVHVSTANAVEHVYLGAAVALRPDLLPGGGD